MTTAIAIVGMACRYPDARTPLELWENVLAQRRAFRRMPAERLRLEDYRDGPDATYATQAAVIEGYEFDRVRFKVPGSAFRSADLVHWLALDVGAQAFADAGFPEGAGLPRESTGVVLGNTLTGEFSRASGLRLRWPYVRRVLEPALMERGWDAEVRRDFLAALEERYKAPFPAITEDTLAGGLSNTIAGRLCNHFDLKGGGYTIDGACAASLLAVATACTQLVAGDLDVALAGGVDLSLDPFELVGFAKAGALAAEAMRVFDVRSAGFWPGEGCGAVALMRYADAVAERRRIYAVIRGWGISSDGTGGITRPEAEGQRLALRRAYRRAGFGIESVSYFEAHGTGTAVGDAAELEALSVARREAGAAPPAVISTIKANIGHTKAAAGVAGLIKAALAVHHQILPPTPGCETPRPELVGEDRVLRALPSAEPWPAERCLRAGVSAMGFGGINSHLVIEGVALGRRPGFTPREEVLARSAQDVELLLLAAADAEALGAQVAALRAVAPRLSRAELGDLAAAHARALADGPLRAAVVAGTAEELARRLETLHAWLAEPGRVRLDVRDGVFLGTGTAAARIGFLFPGQGTPAHLDGGRLRRRFAAADRLYAAAHLPETGDGVLTAIAQPAIVTASLAGAEVLARLGVTARVAVGHSLGELTALSWAGAFDARTAVRIATARGRAMAEHGSAGGRMASVGGAVGQVTALLNGGPIVVAALNSPRQTVVSGDAAAVAAVVARARAAGLPAVELPVSHAFHSPLVAAAAAPLAASLAREDVRRPERAVASTVTGTLLGPGEDLRALLVRQVTAPVRFTEAVAAAAAEVDLWVEVGPGQVLGGMLAEFAAAAPVVSLDAGGRSLRGLLGAVAAAFVLGARVDGHALFADRFTRPFDLERRPRFLASPCEAPPVVEAASRAARETDPAASADDAGTVAIPAAESSLEVVRHLVAERAELPPSAVRDDHGLLRDLHLSSLAVGQLVATAARRLGLAPPLALTDYADATVAEVALALDERARTGGLAGVETGLPPGVGSWIRSFSVELAESPAVLTAPAESGATRGAGGWRVLGGPEAPLAARLAERLRGAEGVGVVVCLPPEPATRHVGALLEGARAALAAREAGTRFVVVQHGGGGGGFARTLHLEAPDVTVCVVDVPADHPQAVEWAAAEALAAEGYREAHYDAGGVRRTPVLRLLPGGDALASARLGPADVLLVTGGGKGIAAECALALARDTGVRLALIGRAQPASDEELASNLARFTASGVTFHYMAADVTSPAAVRGAVVETAVRLGPVTAVLHGAGMNQPKRLAGLEEADVLRTLAPKVDGARNVLAAVDPGALRLFVTFGSIIARIGLPGEADYALANEWLAALTERWGAAHPHCRCLCLEWSVWSGVGMGERLGRVDALMEQGITPIPPDEGIAVLRQLIEAPPAAVSVVVTGRYGDPPTLRPEATPLPFWRFLELPRVHFPGVELVVDVEVSPGSDPYVDDHVFQGERLLPAVMGLEAMAQTAAALAGAAEPPVFEDVRLVRPITVPDDVPRTLRLAALRHEGGDVEVALRSDETGFQVDHFRATCRFGAGAPADGPPCAGLAGDGALVPLDPSRDLYGGILFHRGRFRRLRGYRVLKARECVAEITPDGAAPWFARYLPSTLLLGDPAARDAAIHAIQASIPHATILPIGVERVVSARIAGPGPMLVHARERQQDGDTFVYDMEVLSADGTLRERWDGLKLRKVGDGALRDAWPVALLGPYLERRVGDLAPGAELAVVTTRRPPAAESGRPRHGADAAIREALGIDAALYRRPDGRPEALPAALPLAASAAHAGSLTLAVAGPTAVGCDVEPVRRRPAALWKDLLGPERFRLAEVIAREAGEDGDSSATRVWAAIECLKKAGAAVDAPLVLVASGPDRWVRLTAGRLAVLTFLAHVQDTDDPLVFATLTEDGRAGV